MSSTEWTIFVIAILIIAVIAIMWGRGRRRR